MLWKCCTQYASKFGKLSSGHRTGKAQFSFQSQRKAMPKNAQTTTQLHSFQFSSVQSLSHVQLFVTPWTAACQASLSTHLANQQRCSKFSKRGFYRMWTENFQMFKLDLEKAEETDIKLPANTIEKARGFRKTSTSASLTMLKPCLCQSQPTVESSSSAANAGPPYLAPEKFADQEATVRTGHGTMD